MKAKSCVIEVATFRSDVSYSDGRHPDEVQFSKDPREDVQRRDFTINGLLMDPMSGEVLDYVGGRSDLEAHVVRTIGDPRQRFAEDKLRMLGRASQRASDTRSIRGPWRPSGKWLDRFSK
jgi:poly(A) polymerase